MTPTEAAIAAWNGSLPIAEEEAPRFLDRLRDLGYELRPIELNQVQQEAADDWEAAGIEQAAEASGPPAMQRPYTSAAADHPHQHTTHTLINVIEALPRYKASPEGMIPDYEGQWIKFLDVQVVVRKAATLGAPVAEIEQAAEDPRREAGDGSGSFQRDPSAAVAPLDVGRLRNVLRYAHISTISWREVDAQLDEIAAAYLAAEEGK